MKEYNPSLILQALEVGDYAFTDYKYDNIVEPNHPGGNFFYVVEKGIDQRLEFTVCGLTFFRYWKTGNWYRDKTEIEANDPQYNKLFYISVADEAVIKAFEKIAGIFIRKVESPLDWVRQAEMNEELNDECYFSDDPDLPIYEGNCVPLDRLDLVICTFKNNIYLREKTIHKPEDDKVGHFWSWGIKDNASPNYWGLFPCVRLLFDSVGAKFVLNKERAIDIIDDGLFYNPWIHEVQKTEKCDWRWHCFSHLWEK